MQSRRPPGLALAPPLLRRPSSLLSLDTAASPHTPRSCASALPPPDLYLQPTISKRTSTTSWNSSNADEMDFDWKQDQVLLLSRTLDALPAHLVTPFNGPIPPSNLLDKIARGVSQAKGPLDWPHSIRATRVKLIELARARAKDDAKKKQQPKVVDTDPSSRYDYFDGPHQNPMHADDVPQRRPLYKQSSMDFIKPSPAEIKDNPTIAQLSNRLQRTDRSIPNPATYHPYKAAPSRIAVRSRTANISQAPKMKADSRSSSPPPASDVPDLIVPNPNSLSNSSSNSSFDSVAPSTALRPHLVRRSASTLSSSSMYSSSSNGSSGMAALQDKRLQRVRRADSFTGAPLNAPVPPPKDYPNKQPVVGMKRAPSYGALAQGVRQEGKLKNERQVQENAFLRAMKDVIAQEGSGSGNGDGKSKKREAEKDKENDEVQQKHNRQLSGSYPSSDEEEKARSKRAKKLRSATNPKAAAGSPGGVVPPSPSVASLSSSTSDESLSASASAYAPGTPMVVVTTAPSTPHPQGESAPTPPAKDRFLSSPKTPKTPRTPSKLPTSKTRVLLKPAPTVLIDSPVASEAKGELKAKGDESKAIKEKARAPKPYLYSVPETLSKDADTCIAMNNSGTNNNNATTNSIASPASPVAANANKRPTAPKMNAQRNPSMFGMELPRLSQFASALSGPSGLSLSIPTATSSKSKHKRTLSRESTATTGTTSSAGSARLSACGGLLPLCGDAVLSVPPSPLTLGFAQDVTRRQPSHVRRSSEGSSGSRVPSSPAARALSPAPTLAASAITSVSALTASPAPASPRVKTLRRVRNRLVPARRISFGSLLESTDDMDMGMEVDGDDRSFDLSGGRMGSGLGMGLSSGLGSGLELGFGADDGKQKEDSGGGGGSVFGAVLGEAFSVKPRAVPDRTPKRDRERERASRERGLKEGTLGSAFRMA
ncbi:hypothetical protein D9619_004451 [Psilocybe cf. subviscida]|uniref:Uncharacterized protein n=1 Tax=Psilocybe cf. subviscida TaxID=2480587 RepID=A0A8H5BP62_9AGAR|nr:hypothetical protein D9619_004451 [Psilocybe cf. subviscida]